MKMILLLAVVLFAAASVQGMMSSVRREATTEREMQYNYNNYNQGGQQNNNAYGYGGYESFEEYQKAQVADKSFTFTGCSTVTTGYGYTTVYATYRLCDKCSTRKSMGCNDSNGRLMKIQRKLLY